MRHLFLVVLLSFFVASCGGDSTKPSYEMLALTSWFVTSPNTNLDQYTSADIRVTFSNDHSTNVMTFNSSPQFQLWSDPDVYDFVAAGDVTINTEPAGVVAPGATYSYDLTVDLRNVPADQMHIALRPVDNNLFGTIGPGFTSVVTSEVIFY